MIQFLQGSLLQGAVIFRYMDCTAQKVFATVSLMLYLYHIKLVKSVFILASFILQKNITAANLTAFFFSVILLYKTLCASQQHLLFEVVV